MPNRHALWLLLLLTAVGLGGCSTPKAPKPTDPNSPGGSVAEGSAGQTVVVAGHKHQVVAFSGYLEIDPYPTGKATQAARVHGKDGKSVTLALRRYEPYLKYVNRRVTGTGYHHPSSYHPRAQSARLFKPLSLRLADGEKPHAAVPTRVPHPPRVNSRAELERLPGRWALIVGKPSYELQYPVAGKRAYHTVKSVTVRLADGFQVKKHLWHAASASTFKRLKAASAATLVVRLWRSNGKARVATSRYCEGVKLRCGMDRPSKH